MRNSHYSVTISPKETPFDPALTCTMEGPELENLLRKASVGTNWIVSCKPLVILSCEDVVDSLFDLALKKVQKETR